MYSAPLHLNLAANPAAALFKRRFGHPPALLVRAPGTLKLLGRLASVAEGLSLSVAVDRHVSLAAAPRTDGRIELIHPLAPDGYSFWLSNLTSETDHAWASPIKAVLAALQRRGVHFSGFSTAIHNAVPPGLGSEAALICATARLVRQMFPFTLTDVGLGSPPKRDPRTQRLPDLTDAERRQVAELCGSAGTRDASLVADHFTPLFARAWQALVVDWHWIVRAESALRDGDHRQLGQFLLLSHESARDGLQAVPPEAEVLVKAARDHRSCLGARALFGGGRIATVSLVNYHEVEVFTAHLATEGERLSGRVIQPVVLPIVDGAS